MYSSDAPVAFSPSQYPIESRIYITGIDVDEMRVYLISNDNQLGAGVSLDTTNNTVSAKPVSSSVVPSSYLVSFVIDAALIQGGWSFVGPYSAGLVPAGNSTYFLIPASVDSTTVSIAFSNNLSAGASSQTYKVNFGLKKDNGAAIWIDDPSIAFNPPD